MSATLLSAETPAISATIVFERQESATVLGAVDTKRYSIPHFIANRLFTDSVTGRLKVVRTVFAAIALSFVPAFTAAVIDARQAARRGIDTRLPFLFDANYGFLALISLPVVLSYLLTDERLLASALRGVVQAGVVNVSKRGVRKLVRKWSAVFALANVSSQAAGATIAAFVIWGNLTTYRRPDMGFWAFPGGDFGYATLPFLLTVWMFYWLCGIYIGRSITTTAMLWDLVRVADVRTLPFHPDNCGGLSPVGRVALRNQYVLSVLGVNVALLIYVTIRFLPKAPGTEGLIVAAASAYVIFGPLVFLLPLVPFRKAMLKTRTDMLGLVATEAEREVDQLRKALRDQRGIQYDTGGLDRLNHIGKLIAELPVWPFDIITVRRFMTAYIVPLLASVAALVAERVGKVFFGLS